jgi:hypothetical protein
LQIFGDGRVSPFPVCRTTVDEASLGGFSENLSALAIKANSRGSAFFAKGISRPGLALLFHFNSYSPHHGKQRGMVESGPATVGFSYKSLENLFS